MNLNRIVEALLFASHEPLTAKALAKIMRSAAQEIGGEENEEFGKISEREVLEAIERLNETYGKRGQAVLLVESSTGWKYYTRPEYAPWVRHLFPSRKPERLSPPALETLAIIAYRQPITKADIEAVRGVSVDGVLQKVIDRGLVCITGKADVPGRPLLYGTTGFFLEHFGVRNLDELPNAAELKRVALPQAPAEPSGKAANGREGISVEKQLALSAVPEGARAHADGAQREAEPPVDREGEGNASAPAVAAAGEND